MRCGLLLLVGVLALITCCAEQAGVSARGAGALLGSAPHAQPHRDPLRALRAHAHARHAMRLTGGSDVDYDDDDDDDDDDEDGGVDNFEDVDKALENMPGFTDPEEFERAKAAAREDDMEAFKKIKKADDKKDQKKKMTPQERMFWRMERYAKPWPPDWLERMENQSNPVVFLDVAIRALDRQSTIEHEGRITLELFAHRVPKTAENFRCFCTGEVLDPRDRKPVGYRNTLIHRIVKGFLLQGGDFVKFDGTGSYSIFGGLRFADEDVSQKHFPGSLSMANAGVPDTNGCQFFINTCAEPSFLDGRHVIVGQVLDGMATVGKIEEVPVVGDDCRPLRKVIVEECGQLC